MNNMWGDMSQYSEIYWPWPIAIYLFLAGFVPIVCSMLLLDLVLFISGREFFAIATLISLEGAILAVLEGIITLFALSFITKFYGGQRR